MHIPYRVAGTYVEPAGKFSAAYGSVAIIDCHYVLENFIDAIFQTAEDNKYLIPPEYYD